MKFIFLQYVESSIIYFVCSQNHPAILSEQIDKTIDIEIENLENSIQEIE